MTFRTTAIGTLAAALMGMAALGASAPLNAQAASEISSELPQSLRQAAIETRSDSSGQIAGTRIANTNYFIIYMRTQNGCGSAGCRAQIWKIEDGTAVRKESIAVGALPIVLLPHVDNGMPRIGVSITTEDNRAAILPIGFDGENYFNDMYDDLVTANSGKPILTEDMLKPF